MEYRCSRLSYEGRNLRTRNGKLLFGPAGNRLFVDYLDKVPGFSGRIDFIHKMNLTEIYQVKTEPKISFICAKTIWYPSHLHMEYESDTLRFQEDKFVTEDDMAVSCQLWENRGKETLSLNLSVEPELCAVEYEAEEIKVTTPVTPHGIRVFYLMGAKGISMKKTLEVKSGDSVSFIICAAFGNAKEEDEGQIRKRLAGYLGTGKDITGYLECHKKEYGRFYASIPNFECSNELLNRTWDYRWYILKNSIARPGCGNIRHGVMYEGRSHKMGKTPFCCEGWEFSRLIPLSTPPQIMDLRWRSDVGVLEEMIQSLLDSQDEETGLFRVMSVDEFGPAYANFAVWAIYQFYLLHREKKPDAKLIEKLERYVEGHDRLYASEEDGLQIERIHQRTGKEYQPSYWYFSGYPSNCKNPDTYTWLKRVDRSIYHYLNIMGLAGLCRICGDEAEKRLTEKAEKLKTEINEKMWDGETRFYYDLHYQTDEKALVKNIVGFYPFWAGIEGEGKESALDELQDKNSFGLEYGLPSVSAECPAYSSSGGWMGQYIKGRDGCVWCGPSWPYTSGIILDMLGKQSKKRNHTLDGLFKKQLELYAMQHFRDQDISRPYLVEHYNPETGEPLSDEVDYNHSFFIQLIMEHVLGITVSENQIVIDPVDIGLTFFRCGPVSVCGHEVNMEYRKNEFFHVRVDGDLHIDEKELCKVYLILENEE